MKTKHILTALALPALLAACNNDEFENMNFEQAQSERPLLSEDFSLKFSDGVETRYAVNGDASLNFNFQSGDQIGAAIIDQFNASKPNDPSQWDIIESLAGNYPFEYNAQSGVWKASTRLGIGHYLFTYPYNPEDNTRGAVSYSLPTVQELYTDENGTVDLNAAIEKDNKAICAALLVEDNSPLEAKLRNLFTYPKFVINFDNGLPITSVSKVVLKYNGNSGEGFLVKGGLDHNKVWTAFKTSETYQQGPDAYFETVTNTSTFLRNNEGGYTTFEYNPYLVAKFPANTAVKTDGTTNNKIVEVRFMMPGAEMSYNNGYNGGEYYNNLSMYIYTNAGVYEIDDVLSAIDFKSTTSASLKERVLARNASYTLNLNKEAVEKSQEELYIVTNTTDWNELVSAYGNEEAYTASAPLKIAVVGSEFTIDADAKMPSKAFFQVNTPVTVKGNVTLNNLIVENNVTIAEGANVTTSGTFKVGYSYEVENNGTLNIAKVLNSRNQVVSYDGISTIVNNTTLNIVADAQASFGLTNEKNATVSNEGIVTVNGQNHGIINNKGTMYTNGLYQNYDWEWVSGQQVITNMPVIKNDGKIISNYKLGNGATIENNGEITCNAATSGEIENSYLINSAKDKITYITTNTGKIVVYEANPGSDIKITTQNGVVEYATANSTEDFDGSIVTDVIASKALTISKIGKVANVTMTDGGKLTLPVASGATTAELNKLTVEGGTVELGSNIKVNVMLTVAQGARITVPSGKVLYATGMVNNGSILVSGTFTTEVNQYAAGLVQAEGPDAKIEFGYDPDQEAQEKAYQSALVNALTYYMNNSNNYKKTYSVVLEDFMASYTVYLDSQVAEFVTLSSFGRKINATDLTTAASTIAASNKTALIASLKANTTFKADATLYKNKVDAYKAFKNGVVKKEGTLAADFGSLTFAQTYAAIALSDSDIDAILEVAKSTMYVWEACLLEQVIDVWASFDGLITNATITNIEYVQYSAAKGKGNLASYYLSKWLQLILSANSTGNPAVAEAQNALSELGIKITSINTLKLYTDEQMEAVDENLK